MSNHMDSIGVHELSQPATGNSQLDAHIINDQCECTGKIRMGPMGIVYFFVIYVVARDPV